MALTDVKQQPVDSRQLTTSRGAALYIGAILGPGLLLLPGLAAAEAGPASILAWIALLGLSGLFAAVIRLLASGRLPTSELISARYPLDQVEAAIRRTEERRDGKVMVRPS